jgi:transcriptional regulator of acetoin/glycerol metabolism
MEFCSGEIKLCGSILVLTDSKAYILKAISPPPLLEIWPKLGLGEGFSLCEEDAGTNAVALCIKHKIPIYLSGAEHYLKIFQNGAVSVPQFFITIFC